LVDETPTTGPFSKTPQLLVEEKPGLKGLVFFIQGPVYREHQSVYQLYFQLFVKILIGQRGSFLPYNHPGFTTTTDPSSPIAREHLELKPFLPAVKIILPTSWCWSFR
jgi:hypothetical protein